MQKIIFYQINLLIYQYNSSFYLTSIESRTFTYYVNNLYNKLKYIKNVGTT